MTGSSVPPIPSDRLSTVSEEERGRILKALGQTPENPACQEWVEKLRRFASVYNRRLGRISRERFGTASDTMLSWMLEVFALYLQETRLGSPSNRVQVLNAYLFVRDAVSGAARRRVEERYPLSSRLLDLVPPPVAEEALLDTAETPVFELDIDRLRKESRGFRSHLAVFCPSRHSLLTLSVLALCDALGLKVDVLVVRRFSRRRLVEEWRRDGTRLIHKVWRKLILRSDENPVSSDVSLKYLRSQLLPPTSDAVRQARRMGAEVIECYDFNDEDVVSRLAGRNLSYGLFTGGGIVRPPTQAAFSGGIINAHMGHLPQYRGMDVVQWPVLEGRRNSVGATAHLMDAGLDTGPAIQRLELDTEAVRSLGEIRNAVAALMPFLLVDSATGLESGRLEAKPQSRVHPLYYYMHGDLLAWVEERLRKPTDAATDAFQKWYVGKVGEVKASISGGPERGSAELA